MPAGAVVKAVAVARAAARMVSEYFIIIQVLRKSILMSGYHGRNEGRGRCGEGFHGD